MPYVEYFSSRKNGKFGNARDGAVTPRERQTSPPRAKLERQGLRIDDIDTADKALVSARIDNSTNELIFERAPISGSGATALILGTVLGGNSTHLSAPVSGTFEPGSFAFPVPLSIDGVNIETNYVPPISDWDAISLPAEFKIGDALPVLPAGISLVKLERPYSFGSFSWDARLPPTVTAQTTQAPALVEATAEPGTENVNITLYFDRNVVRRGPTSSIRIKDVTAGTSFVPTLEVVSGNIVVLRTTVTLDPNHSYTVSVPAAHYRTASGTPTFFSPLIAASPIRFMGDQFSIVYAINRSAVQTFFAGDLVFMTDRGLTITDEVTGTTRSLIDIVSNASNVRSPHNHLNARYDQTGSGGPAR